MSVSNRFQILALSGGGFRGLYTAKILADFEEEIGAPIASRFDLIAGTSIGGVLALALAQEIPAKQLVDLFVEHGGSIFKKRRWSFGGYARAEYDPTALRDLLSADDLFGQRLLGSCKHPVLVPTINYSTGTPQLLKTPHHESLKRDHLLTLVDVALTTSAAPIYFPRHVVNNNQFVDGGLFANAPGLLALHEAEAFFGQQISNVHVLSIGTMSSVFTVDPNRNRAGGAFDWGGWWPPKAPQRMFGLAISVQETLTKLMLSHRLGADRYLHIDDVLTPDRAQAVGLDKTDQGAQEVLLGAASERSKACIGNASCMTYLNNKAAPPKFYYGDHASS